MEALEVLQRRQIWDTPTSTKKSGPDYCRAIHLPSNGILVLNATQTITLAHDATFAPTCTDEPTSSATLPVPVIDLRDPFYASTIPQMFVLGAVLVISWFLLIVLLITPRTTFMLGATSRSLLGRAPFLGSSSGRVGVVGIGGRPWLQKIATLSVGISLLIASVNSFRVVQSQYSQGYEDATAVTSQVVSSLELRIIRTVSDTFLWLAQTQTLIRLFPRHREKIIIKWAGFGLIFLDTLFSILNNFVPTTANPKYPQVPGKLQQAVPALTYLFELALSCLYASCVVFYSMVKRRFAYFHPKMRNILIVAILSLVSISIPILFFIMDIADSSLAGWGDYVRWVGAAAASVVVWEWVERIEALEREERKEGILGREIFDGDEMLENAPSADAQWSGGGSLRPPKDDGPNGATKAFANSGRGGSGIVARVVQVGATMRRPGKPFTASQGAGAQVQRTQSRPRPQFAHQPASVPIQVSSPVSRSDTTSAASTVYHIVHHPISTASLPATPTMLSTIHSTTQLPQEATSSTTSSTHSSLQDPALPQTTTATPNQALTAPYRPRLVPLSQMNPFKRRRRDSPPPEVSRATATGANNAQPSVADQKSKEKDVINPFRRHQPIPISELPLVVVPLQPRGQVWSPPPEDEDTTSDTPRTGSLGRSEPGSLDGVSQGGLSSSANDSASGTTSTFTSNPSLTVEHARSQPRRSIVALGQELSRSDSDDASAEAG